MSVTLRVSRTKSYRPEMRLPIKHYMFGGGTIDGRSLDLIHSLFESQWTTEIMDTEHTQRKLSWSALLGRAS